MRYVAVLILASCGGGDVEPCTVADSPGGVVIECPDGSRAVVDGSRVSSTYLCAGPLSGTTLSVSYRVTILSSGDVFAYAGVRNAALEIGASAYYAATQVGAVTAKVIFTGDFYGTATAGWWEVSLDTAAGGSAVVYHDAEVGGGSDSWSMPASACITNHY